MKYNLKTIRGKLTIFVICLGAVLMSIVWLLTVALFEPTYSRMINSEIDSTLNSVISIVEKSQNLTEISEQINQLASDGICIDISDSKTLSCVGLSEGVGENCIVHASDGEGFNFFASNTNTKNAILMRREILENGKTTTTFEVEQIPVQAVTGDFTDNGYIIIVSSALERVTQAVSVVKSQLALVAAIVLIVSVAGSLIFSKWFCRPITDLSSAVKKVAGGDFTARATAKSNDEIGQLADEFNRMTDEIGKANILQQELISNVSHDLRTPLTLIKGYAENGRDINITNTEILKEDLNIIIDEADRLTALVNSVMELSKFSSGVNHPKYTHFDLVELSADVIRKYRNISRLKDFEIELIAPAEAEVKADPQQIERVLHNLVSNAVAHISSGGKITVRLIEEEATIKIEIEDTGSGISREELPHIFDRYYRSRTNEGKQGSGLGLSIVKAILVAHNSEFGVRSTVGVGSTFWFKIG